MTLTDLEKTAMFSCQQQGCAEEVSYHADMLMLFEGEPICEGCYDYLGVDEDAPLWCDLSGFDPFKEYRKSVLEEAAKVAEDLDGLENLGPNIPAAIRALAEDKP